MKLLHGYESFSILNYGIDRNGKTLPVFLISWGSGQNALYTYLLLPFVYLFGLSSLTIRLPMAILGCISLYAFYAILKSIFNKRIALIGLFLLAISPWHIMKCRWGLESNTFPDIILIATALLISSIICHLYFTE